jgi:glycosyltransferase involved in cell wall biosynthesis
MMSINAPRVSIITVTYNAFALLEKTIARIDNLAYPNIEHVIVDGGSEDGTLDLFQRPRRTTARMLSEPDDGIYDAMNKGIRLATGEYLWFINAGDAPTMSTVLDPLLKPEPPDILYGDTRLIDSTGRLSKVAKAPARLDWRQMTQGMVVSHQSIIVRRSIAPLYDRRFRFIADQKWMVDSLRHATSCRHSGGALADYLLGGVSERQYSCFLREKIRYSFTDLPWESAVAISTKDLMVAARLLCTRSLRWMHRNRPFKPLI